MPEQTADLRPDPRIADDIAGYLDMLRRLRTWCGKPSLSVLASRSGIPRSTIHDALSPQRINLPALGVVRSLVLALAAEPQEVFQWTRAWRALQPDVAGSAQSPATCAESGVRPRQLPGDATGFVGRRAEEKQLAELGMDGIVVISGQGGMGKTALAVHWAHHIAANFPDGQLYVNLRGFSAQPPLTAGRALACLLHGLGLSSEQIPDDPDKAAGLLRTLLAGRRVLILLDDAADAAQVRPLLPGEPGCLVMVTSRHSLSGLVALDGARGLSLRRLTAVDASELFARMLGAERTGREEQAVAEISELCGQLPLALRIAAANLTERPRQTIAEYAVALRDGDRLAVLSVAGDDEAAVEAVFLMSYQRLAPDLRRMFRRLSTIAGADFTATTAAVLVGCRPAAALVQLESLAAAHLIGRLHGERYDLHDLMRLCAQARLSDDDEPNVIRRRLLDWTLQTTVNAVETLRPQGIRLPPRSPGSNGETPLTFDDVHSARSWLDAERTALVAMIVDAAHRGLDSDAWYLADALRGYFWLRVPRADWFEAAETGLTAALRARDTGAAAAMYHCLGDASWNADDYGTAIEHLNAGLELSRRAGDRQREVALLINLGLVHHEATELVAAGEHLFAAVRVCRELGDQRGEAGVLGRLGALYKDLGQLDQAEQTLRLAAERQLEHGTRYRFAGVIGNLAIVLRHQGKLAEAVTCLVEAAAIYDEVGNKQGQACMLDELAVTELEWDRLPAALDRARQASRLAGETGELRIAADAAVTLATAEFRSCIGQPTRRLAESLRIARAGGHRYTEIMALLALSEWASGQGQHPLAMRRAEQALALAGEAGFALLEAQAMTRLAWASEAAGRHAEAALLARRAFVAHRECGQALGEARTLLLLDRIMTELGRDDEARNARTAAGEALRRTDVSWAELVTHAG